MTLTDTKIEEYLEWGGSDGLLDNPKTRELVNITDWLTTAFAEVREAERATVKEVIEKKEAHHKWSKLYKEGLIKDIKAL